MIELWWQYLLFGIACYFLSNFNFAVFISKNFKHTDIRAVGSGNPGTTNMFRAFGLKYGVVTFACDMFKGVICAGGGLLLFYLIGKNMGFEGEELISSYKFGGYFGGLCAGIGHVFPVLYRFKGGKGFATGIGVFLVLNPIFTIIAIIVGFIVLMITDLMSVYAILFFSIITLEGAVTLLPSNYPLFIMVALYYLLVLYAHRHNIKRLYRGEENKMGIARIFGRKKDDASNSDK